MRKMKNFFEDIEQDLVGSHLDSYWTGFVPVAYALFDKEFVYLFNHPKLIKSPNKNYQILERDDQFMACTLILYEDYPTAIVDLELYHNYASLYSILVHELFHGFQYIKGEKRFADETMGITYPLSKENIQLRSQERLYLYRAVLEKDRVKKRQYLATFISLREKRGNLIDEYLVYENLIETIEGPAWYVELRSFFEKSQQSYRFILEKYGEQLIDNFDSTLNIRKSCYSSGLFMCLLLDEFLPKWKDSFWDQEKTIYDLLKQIPLNEAIQINETEKNPETGKVIDYVLENRKRTIANLEKEKGINLFIKGKINLKSFDPMNIVLSGDKVLHRSFLKVEINNQDYLIQQPVIAYCKGGFRNIIKLHLLLKEKPIENIDSLTVDCVGRIKGKYEKEGTSLYLNVN